MDLIVKMKFGSHLYGTATTDSDMDYKGIFLPSREQILLGKIPKCHSFSTGNGITRNTSADIDLEIYSLHYFIKLACEGQTVAMDMLHAPQDMLIEKSDIWEAIVNQRHRFYTRNLNAFITYARRQASKYGIKGSRLSAAQSVLAVLRSTDPDRKLRDIWQDLPRIDHCHETGTDPNGMRQYQVCGKTFQESASIGYVIPILEKFYDEYGHRAKLAAENKNIDWKAVSHALRAAIQTKEIMTTNTITFPLKDAGYLIQVKQGELDYKTCVAPHLESMMEELENLVKTSRLPEKADTDYWDRFVCDVVESQRFKRDL